MAHLVMKDARMLAGSHQEVRIQIARRLASRYQIARELASSEDGIWCQVSAF